MIGSAGGVAWTHAGWPGVVVFCLVLGVMAMVLGVLMARVQPLTVPEVPSMGPVEP